MASANTPWAADFEEKLTAIGVPPFAVDSILTAASEAHHAAFLRNPYMVFNWVELSFPRTDQMIQTARLAPPDSRGRMIAAAEYVLRAEASRDGHTWMGFREIVGALARVRTEPPLPRDARSLITTLSNRPFKALSGDRFALLKFYEAEEYVAKTLGFMADSNAKFPESGKKLVGLTPEQEAGVSTILRNPVSLLTGGPGCGKTFTIRGVIEAAGTDGVCLCAPTGKAAKRMQQSTGCPASTIHSLITDMSAGERSFHTLIIDEASMIPVELMADLLRSVKADGAKPLRMLLVGDNDQLPPIGAGRVFGDLIESRRIPTVTLTKIMRQAAGSSITRNANNVRNGLPLENTNKDPGTDCHSTLNAPIEQQVDILLAGIATGLPTHKLKNGKYIHPTRDIMLLTPQHKGLMGCFNLNCLLQERLNPRDPSKNERVIKMDDNEFTLREGDKVIITKNLRRIGVVNGEMGFIKSINRREMVIDFDEGKVVSFDKADSYHVRPGYAITIHKAQGSESPVVVAVFSEETPSGMRSRNLLYTAMTRARENLWLMGNKDIVAECIANGRPSTRRTCLPNLVGEYVKGHQEAVSDSLSLPPISVPIAHVRAPQNRNELVF